MNFRTALFIFTALWTSALSAQTETLSKPTLKTKPGWYVPRSTHARDATQIEKPGWFTPQRSLTTSAAKSRLGWDSPKATAAGDSTLSVNRPGWYIPDSIRGSRVSRLTPFTSLDDHDPEALARANYLGKPQTQSSDALAAKIKGKSSGSRGGGKKGSESHSGEHFRSKLRLPSFDEPMAAETAKSKSP
jgi:hypothetical protein